MGALIKKEKRDEEHQKVIQAVDTCIEESWEKTSGEADPSMDDNTLLK